MKAIMWGAGNVVAVARSGENTDSAELCLELLITVALRNRDRVALLWPLVHEFLAACTSPEAVEKTNPLVERAAMGLMRVSAQYVFLPKCMGQKGNSGSARVGCCVWLRNCTDCKRCHWFAYAGT